MSSRRPLALVTGASGGIGEAVALELARRGHDLVLVARREDALRVVADATRAHGAATTVMTQDLAVAGAGAALAQRLTDASLEVDVVVNNAGFADFGAFTDADPNKLTAMMQLNMITLTDLTRAVLPGMVERGRGRILNVASTAAFMPGPHMAVYYATKAYVLSLGEALGEELSGTGVTVTTLCPGPTQTGFQAAAAMEDSKLVAGGGLMDAATVARAGVDAMLAGRPVVVPGWKNRMQALTPRLLPRRMVPGIVARAQAAVH